MYGTNVKESKKQKIVIRSCVLH